MPTIGKGLQAYIAGQSGLPETAAGHKQKPVKDFGWKPSDAETKRDIERDKKFAPIEREIFMANRRDPEKEVAQEASRKPVVSSKKPRIGMGLHRLMQDVKGAVVDTIMPDPDGLESMGHFELMEKRSGAKTKEEQNRLAPYEHRAWAREYVKENPTAAVVLPGLIMAYNAAKGMGMREGRSDPSADAILEGLKGTVEGLGGSARELLD
jgi:hypothetical protein